jgi:hypothetical protein
MKPIEQHKLTPQALNSLKNVLHQIPSEHPVVRPTLRKWNLVWGSAIVAAAASIALVIGLFPPTSSADLEEFWPEELYDLGYVQVDDILEWTDPDSLDIFQSSLDEDFYFEYLNNSEDYIYQL